MSNNPSTIARGNIVNHWVLAPTLSPSIVAPNTTAEQTFTITGLALGDFVEVTKPTNQANLALLNARVSAKDTLALTFGNFSSGTITPTASEVYSALVQRPENLVNGASSLTVSF
jgi:hypothetical protein